LILLATLVSAPWVRAVDYSETIDGDISNDRFSTTQIVLTAGANTVSGFFGQSPTPDVTDLDYFTVVVPGGFKIEDLWLTQLRAGGANSFLGVQAGPIMTVAPDSRDPSPLLGWNHIYNSQVGSDLLPSLGLSNLSPGSYTFWINETDGSDFYPYMLDFEVTPIPESSTVALILGGIGFAAAVCRRRQWASGVFS
jgi:hypothetical protein